MKEKLLFVLPEPLEECLFALSVLSKYMLIRYVTARSTDELVVVCKHEELHDFVRACWVFATVVVKPTREQLEEADFVHEFDTAACYRITQAVQKSIADAYAIKLGVDLVRQLPPVLVEDTPEKVSTLLVAARNTLDGTDASWRWPHLEDFYDQLEENKIPVEFLPETASWNEMRAAVGRASVVVGVRSSVTLIAAAANKIVMELVPRGREHREWFRKTECKSYRMMYGNLVDMVPMYVWEQVEKLMKDLRGPMLDRAEKEAANV